MSIELEQIIESLLFLSSDPVTPEALAEATEAELHDVTTALERLREYYEFERRGLVLRADPSNNYQSFYMFVIEPGLFQIRFRKLVNGSPTTLASWFSTVLPAPTG